MIFVVGLSYRSAPVDVRERLAVPSERLGELLARLDARPELREVVFLSTCNRVEVFATAAEAAEQATRAVREVLAEEAGVADPDDLAPYLYEQVGEAAVRHIFRVTASLDSMVLGEPQILGQVKSAVEAANAAGTVGTLLGRCLARSFAVAKRVRTETALGAGLVSVSSVAVDLARRIFGDLERHTVLLVGAGEMAEAAAKSLGKGAKAVRVVNRSFDRGRALAERIGGEAAPWAELEAELARADVVITSTASPTVIVTADMVRRVMKLRRGRTLFFVDIAVPRNVEPAAHDIDNAYVFNIDDLEQQVAEGLKARQNEVAQADRMIDDELRDFEAWRRGQKVQPTIVALRAKTRGVLLSELERSLAGRLKHLGDGDRAALAQMVESATNKLLHAPTTKLRTSAGEGYGADYVEAVRELFDLPEVAEGPSGPLSEPPRSGREPRSDAQPVEDERLPN